MSTRDLDQMWARHSAEWREPAQVASQWEEAASVDPGLLKYRVRGDWWGILESTGSTLLVTREYEHLALALCVVDGAPVVSYMKLPHPSGLAVDRDRGVVYIASTRNPNQVYDFEPVSGLKPRLDMDGAPAVSGRPLVPARSRYYPGCTYMHDLAVIGGEVYANSVGQNAVVRLGDGGDAERVWWPRCIETAGGPVFGQNHIQLNSIAAGDDLEGSYFSASAAAISARRPGHRNFPVDGRGVIFSGLSREPVAGGLTRPHSARLFEGRVWVDNSGYGQVGFAEDGKFIPVAGLPGWTRGLGFHDKMAFVGTSRVLPRFTQYAPGLDVERSVCGLHAVDTRSGQILGSLTWPQGNQVFAVELAPTSLTTGFPFRADRRRSAETEKKLFYAFETHRA